MSDYRGLDSAESRARFLAYLLHKSLSEIVHTHPTVNMERSEGVIGCDFRVTLPLLATSLTELILNTVDSICKHESTIRPIANTDQHSVVVLVNPVTVDQHAIIGITVACVPRPHHYVIANRKPS